MRCRSWELASERVSDSAAGHGDADADQDQAADEFTALAGAGADPAASSRPISDMLMLMTPITMAARARLTWKAPRAKPTARLSMLRAAPLTSSHPVGWSAGVAGA